MPAIKFSSSIAPPEDPRFKKTFFLVEATDLERSYLWEHWHGRMRWEQDSFGCLGQVGTLGRRPVTILVFWVRIDGRLVAFWHSPSQVTDHKMIRLWFAKNCRPPKWDNGKRKACCDATNFHHCIDAIREANEREPIATAS